jgi:hypothetical protein
MSKNSHLAIKIGRYLSKSPSFIEIARTSDEEYLPFANSELVVVRRVEIVQNSGVVTRGRMIRWNLSRIIIAYSIQYNKSMNRKTPEEASPPQRDLVRCLHLSYLDLLE